MTLLDEAKTSKRRVGGLCSIVAIRAAIGPAEFDEAMRSDANTASINRALKERGFTIADDTLGRHRAGDCLCPR